MAEKKPFSRFPPTIIPTNYNITMIPDLLALTFSGNETITIQVKETTQIVELNAADLQIHCIEYWNGQDVSEVVGTVELNTESERAILTFPSSLAVGEGFLYLEFTGTLNDKMKGFYRSKYTDLSGESQFAVVTQFEATDARMALPCWDEPALKATFDVTLVVPQNRVALSNMPVVDEVHLKDGKKSVTFGQTPIMSTYLLAFVVGEYDFLEATDRDGILVRVYTPVGKTEQGQFALTVAVETLPFYKDYFGIAYPLPKMDLIAIPDLAIVAMENWGLVTYAETALLIDPVNSSNSSKQSVALVVGHELAHQWFGNLVTMEWWTHLWLNEGFASFIEYLCVDHCFPKYDIWTQFVKQDLSSALELDALRNSHPIEVPVGHPSEVDEIFDAISYSKGASVIRMLHSWIGDQAFRTGLNQYLTKFAYRNASTENLWDSLGHASGKPVRQVMSTWTSQMGFPVLEVSQHQDGDKRLVTITQSKFCADGKSCEGSYHWMVPLAISTSSSPSTAVFTDVLQDSSATYTLPNVKAGEWIKVNPGTIGMYRVRYSSDMLDSLLPAIRDRTIPPRDRLGLQNDLFALARSGQCSIVDALKVALAFQYEIDFTVWSDLSVNLNVCAMLIQYTDYSELFNKFQEYLYKDIANKLGWEKSAQEGPMDTMLRAVVLSKLGCLGHNPTVDHCLKRFESHYNGSAPVDPDLRTAVYSTALKYGDLSHHDKLLELYDKTELSEEKVRIQHCLGSVSDESRLKEVLRFAISEKVRPQDTISCLASVAATAVGSDLVWKFVKDNWAWFSDMYQSSILMARLVKVATENFTDLAMVSDIKEFFSKNPAPSAQRTILQSCESIEINAALLGRDKQRMREFLTSAISQ